MRNEAAPLREIAPHVPVTTNFMGTYPGLDYRRFAGEIDFASWDSYPAFVGSLDDPNTWVTVAFRHDLTRCLAPSRRWMLMECSPSSSNWYSSMALKRPGVHRFEAMQCVAHGADGVQYFQWRQSRGSQEQFHGAVVGHAAGAEGRVFREVRQVGEELESLADVAGSGVEAEVAVVYDWEARWALEAACGPIQGDKRYEATCVEHYRAFWEAAIPVDVVGLNDPLDRYKVVVAPMAYSLPDGFAERIDAFVQNGGTFLTTYLSGWTDPSSLVFEGGFLASLRRTLGVWSEEIDALPSGATARVDMADGASHEARSFCELVHLDGATALGVYGSEFYAGRPAVTVNRRGAGRAYYVAARLGREFTEPFLAEIAREAGVRSVWEGLPDGVTAQKRTDGVQEWVFVMNACSTPKTVTSADGTESVLPPFGVEARTP
jgi:beta-galactosidase